MFLRSVLAFCLSVTIFMSRLQSKDHSSLIISSLAILVSAVVLSLMLWILCWRRLSEPHSASDHWSEYKSEIISSALCEGAFCKPPGVEGSIDFKKLLPSLQEKAVFARLAKHESSHGHGPQQNNQSKNADTCKNYSTFPYAADPLLAQLVGAPSVTASNEGVLSVNLQCESATCPEHWSEY